MSTSGDYGTHRGDAMGGANASPVFSTSLVNPDLYDDGAPWSSHYATDAWELGVGVMFDITLHANTNILLGARDDYSRAENVDYAGTLDLAAGTPAAPAVFRTADARASGARLRHVVERELHAPFAE